MVFVDVVRKRVLLVKRLGEVRDDLRVCECPRVPRLIPSLIKTRSEKVRRKDVGNGVLQMQ